MKYCKVLVFSVQEANLSALNSCLAFSFYGTDVTAVTLAQFSMRSQFSRRNVQSIIHFIKS